MLNLINVKNPYEAKNVALNELQKYVSSSVVSKMYGIGTISRFNTFYVNESNVDVSVDIQFPIGARTFTFSSQVLSFEYYNEIKSILNDLKVYLNDYSNKQKIEFERKNQLLREEKLRLELERIKKQEEEKKKNLIKRAIEKLDSSIANVDSKSNYSSDEMFYHILGYMAKNTTSITASMPDFMESWFIYNFGDVKRTIYDSDKLTSGGHKMKYSLSLRINFKSKSQIPQALLSQCSSSTRKVIDNIGFVWDLVSHYNFSIGKEQDIDSIELCVPSEYIKAFRDGLSL